MLTTTLILLTATLPLAADSDAEQLNAQVRKLVRQLGSSEVAQRESAETSLLELGSLALDAVENYLPHPDAEINARLQRVQESLYKRAVEAATAATTVTLDVKDKPLSEVLEMIQQQTVNRIVDKRTRASDPISSLKLTDAPYWQALDETLDAAELTTYNYSGEASATAIVARPLGAMPRTDMAAYSGVFRFEPTQVEAIRDLRNPANKVMKLFLEVTWEPRLSPISLSQTLDTLTLTDEDGRRIELAGAGVIGADITPGAAGTDLEIPVVLPSRDVEKIATLEGEIAVMIPGRVEKFTFDELSQAKDTEQKKASATVILQSIRKNNAIYEVRMVLRFDKAANALESHRGWVFNNPFYLLDKEGQRIDHAGFQTTRQTPNEVGLAINFAVDNIDDYQFVYQTPAAVVQKKIPYTLKNIPLP